MKTVVIRYNAGNILSVEHALARLGINSIITDDHEEIKSADKVIFPGVGEASTTMEHLKLNGLDRLIIDLKQPTIGVCLGMQLMCSYSEENSTKCLGIFSEKVQKFNADNDQSYKVPHMGWNTIYDLKSELYTNVKEEEYTYFVHSYYVPVSEHTIATTDYITPFSAAIKKDNFYAVQFHPEKSAYTGEQILQNFLDL